MLVYGYIPDPRAVNQIVHRMYFMTVRNTRSKELCAPARAGQHIYLVLCPLKSALFTKTPDAKAIKIVKIDDLPVKSKNKIIKICAKFCILVKV